MIYQIVLMRQFDEPLNFGLCSFQDQDCQNFEENMNIYPLSQVYPKIDISPYPFSIATMKLLCKPQVQQFDPYSQEISKQLIQKIET